MPDSPVPLALADSWQFVIDTEDVLYFPRTPTESGFTPANGATVENTKKLDLDSSLIASDAVLWQGGQHWSLWRTQLDLAGLEGYEPQELDVIQDGDGVRYHIKNIKYAALRTRYECDCILEVS